jgi:hypothetical protein
MKNSIKISVITLSLLSFLNLHSNAQSTAKTESYGSGIRLSIGADGGIPVGSLNNSYDWNLGGSIQADFPIVKDQLYVTVNSGYDNFFARDNSNLSDIEMIPVKGGLKYFPVKWCYIQGEAGASFITNKAALGANNTAVFVYAPQVGVLINTGGKNYIDAGFRFESNAAFYNGGKTNNFLALRVAYAFNL